LKSIFKLRYNSKVKLIGEFIVGEKIFKELEVFNLGNIDISEGSTSD